MLQSIRVLIISSLISSFMFADVFMTELTDPQNSSDAGRYVELYNTGDSDVDLSSGWTVQRWTNANADPTASSIVGLTGTISAGGFYIICNDAGKYNTTYDLTCDQDIGTGGFADSNGDDNMALLDDGGVIVDMFGVAGEDGSGTGHEFEDGRAERAESNTTASATWDESDWNIDNDSGGGDGNQYAPEGFDPGAWIGASTGGGSDTCDDESACNTGADGACEYPDTGYDCDGNCIADVDCAGVCGGDAEIDECGECGGDGSACAEPPANLFFSEAAEGSSNNKYLEIYNATDDGVDLSGYSLSSCSNGCDAVGAWDYADNVTFEAGTTVASGDVYIVCHGSSDDLILAECDQTFTYLSNGDDVFALTQTGTGIVLDVIGVVGEDPGSGWEVAGIADATKDHTLVRKAEVTTGNALWLDNTETGEAGSAGTDADNSEWIVFDQNTWDYLGSHPHDFSTDVLGCMDPDACNYNPDATVDDGTCATVDCAGECGGSAVCEVAVTFSVDMSIQGVTGDVTVRTSTENGDYMPSDWFVMDDSDGDAVYTYTMMLETGIEYGYNFNDGGYESGDGLADCAGGNYGNDRYVTPGDTDMTLGTVCFGSCEACPAIVEGCTDDTATNYDPDATVDDGTCEYDTFEAANLFISEAAEGSSNNKYFEVYNASDESVDLSNYAYPTVSNDPSVPGEPEYWNTFAEGATVAAGDVYVVCHGSADEFILAECDENYTYLSNGDDGLCLVAGSDANFEILDCVGDWNGDPGSGWDIAGVSSATKDHTIVRKADVTTGNDGMWEFSAGTSDDDSEWVVLDQNDWTYLGSHPHTFEPECSQDGDANGDGTLNVTDIVLLIGFILDSNITDEILCSSDTNGDGAVNVTDIVAIVNTIVSGGLSLNDDNATEATLIIRGDNLSIEGKNGKIQGVQLTLGHDEDIDILDLVDVDESKLEFAKSNSIDRNTTMIFIIKNDLNYIGTIKGDFKILSKTVVTPIAEEIVSNIVIEPVDFELGTAYPNPFNPTTNLQLVLPETGYVSVKIYNLVGQEVATLAEGIMESNSIGYTLQWNASNMASGVYLVRAEVAGQVSTQKLMLLK